MTGVENKFAELKKAGKKGLIIYITAGIPDADSTVQLVLEAEKAGADMVELGIPFSDPMVDGPVIQKASYDAIQKGMNLHRDRRDGSSENELFFKKACLTFLSGSHQSSR